MQLCLRNSTKKNNEMYEQTQKDTSYANPYLKYSNEFLVEPVHIFQ